MNRALSPSYPAITLPSGRTLTFRHYTMWEKRFIMHSYVEELKEDGVFDQELLAAICLVTMDGRPVDFGIVHDYMDRYISGKAVGAGARLNHLKKSEVCNAIYNTMLEYFDYNDADWQYYIAVFLGVCMPSEEIKNRIDADIKNVLAAVTSTEAASRKDLVSVDSAESGPKVNFV